MSRPSYEAKARIPVALEDAIQDTQDTLKCERSEAIRVLLQRGAEEPSPTPVLVRPLWADGTLGAISLVREAAYACGREAKELRPLVAEAMGDQVEIRRRLATVSDEVYGCYREIANIRDALRGLDATEVEQVRNHIGTLRDSAGDDPGAAAVLKLLKKMGF